MNAKTFKFIAALYVLGAIVYYLWITYENTLMKDAPMSLRASLSATWPISIWRKV